MKENATFLTYTYDKNSHFDSKSLTSYPKKKGFKWPNTHQLTGNFDVGDHVLVVKKISVLTKFYFRVFSYF